MSTIYSNRPVQEQTRFPWGAVAAGGAVAASIGGVALALRRGKLPGLRNFINKARSVGQETFNKAWGAGRDAYSRVSKSVQERFAKPGISSYSSDISAFSYGPTDSMASNPMAFSNWSKTYSSMSRTFGGNNPSASFRGSGGFRNGGGR